MTQQLNDCNVGENFEGCLLIKTVSKRQTNFGDDYLAMNLGDRSGDITAMVWKVSDEDVERYISGSIAYVQGTVIEYKGNRQLQISGITADGPAAQVKPEDLMEQAPIERPQLEQDIQNCIQVIKNETIREVVTSIVDRNREDFYAYPAAASIHHAYIRGLAHHTTTMLHTAVALLNVYPNLNKDLLFGGIIIHDIGKIHEFTSMTNTERTVQGTLLGHIPMMVSEIERTAVELGIDPQKEEIILLQHMVLSHHGKPEWGSARTPLLMEAEILHMIDNLDAKMNTMTKELETTSAGEFTGKIFALDNRTLYKPLNVQ